MIIYKNLGLDYIYKNLGLDYIYEKRKKERRINTFGDVCWFFRSFKNWNLLESLIYLKACLKIVVFSWYARRSLPFVSRFTSILMLEDSQLRLLNNISLLSVYIYITIKKKKWWEFSHGAPQLQEAFDEILTLHKS
jgi:hypothetical protein